MKKGSILSMSLVGCAILFAGCFPGGGGYAADHQAGFFTGIWHGWIAPVSLIVSIFSDTIRIYEVNNSGWWYDFGFYIALVGGFGGISLTRRKVKGWKSENR